MMIIRAKVKPGSLKNNLEKQEDGTYLIHTIEKAVDGKANASIIKIVSKEFGVDFRKVLIKNPKSRNKIIEIIK